MERELEVKLLGLDTEALEKKVEEKGGIFLGEELQVNITINSSTHPIPEEQGYLRLRTVEAGGKTAHIFTFKEQKTKDGIRDNLEHSTLISDPKELLGILELLGYDQRDRGTKKRVSWSYKEGRFDFDTWDSDTYPYPYVELEVSRASQLDVLLEEFSIDRKYVCTKSIGELKREWKEGQKE